MLNSLELIAAVNFCQKTANVWQIVGYVLLVFKIVIPLLLIIFGTLDLGKAVVASKDDEVKKAATHLAWRAVGAVVIFFIPTIVGLVLSLVSNFGGDAKSDYETCKDCLVNPNEAECENFASDAWDGNVD